MKVLKVGAVMTTILLIILSMTPKVISQDYYKKLELSKKTEEAFEVIKTEKILKGIQVNDSSGMLGQDFTWITTTLGSKESKITSTNPNFSVVIYEYIMQLNLEKGDKIAVNLSGSFPALNVATLLAIETLDLEPVIIASIGASTYGANDPEMTYLDMEYLLYQKGLIKHQAYVFSNGGHNDIGSDMDKEQVESIIIRLEGLGYHHYYEEDLEKNINDRMTIYKDCEALINVGGNMVSQTETDFGFFDGYGYIDASQKRNFSNDGLIGRFLSEGHDVINLLNIKEIATIHGLPIASIDALEVGSGDPFYEKTYSKIILILLIIVMLITMLGVWHVRRSEIKNAVARHISS